MGPERNQCPVLIERLLKSPESVMADPPRFEHGLQAPQAHVISRLHYGSSDFWTVGSGLIPTVGITSRGGGVSSNSVVRASSTLVPTSALGSCG